MTNSNGSDPLAPNHATPVSRSPVADAERARALRELESGPASFSADRAYRYTLWRTWDESRRLLMVIGLNPSTADETKLDPTLRRCAGFAYDWGLGGLVMTNLFAFRATDPIDMKASGEPMGLFNDSWLTAIATAEGQLKFACRPLVLAAWGTHGGWLGRDEEVVRLLTSRGVDLHCLEKTKGGYPKHPLYVSRENPRGSGVLRRPAPFRQGVVQDSR